jgi:Flp pilus assembly protein TadB
MTLPWARMRGGSGPPITPSAERGIRAQAENKASPVDSRRQRQRRSAEPTLARVVGEVVVALVALSIVVGAAVALPVWLSRSYAIGLTAAILIASLLVLAFKSRRGLRRRLHHQNHPAHPNAQPSGPGQLSS